MTSPEFQEFQHDFNGSNTAFLNRIASDLRERLIANSHQLFSEAFIEDEQNRDRLESVVTHGGDEPFVEELNRSGMPLFLKNHTPGLTDIELGIDFVKAVSCRLVQKKLVPDEAKTITPMHHWPMGDEMIIYIPVVEQIDEDVTKPLEPPEFSSDNIFIRHISTQRDENGVVIKQVSNLYAIGEEYCFKHVEFVDADAELDLMMRDVTGFAEDFGLERLNLEALVGFNKDMTSMKIWPINTFWPGITTGELDIAQ